MTNIKERILQICEYKKVSKETFLSKIGSSYANFKGKAKKTSLNSDVVANILTIYSDINPEWLLTGKGEMLRLERQNFDLSGNYFASNVNSSGNNTVQSTISQESLIEITKSWQDIIKAQQGHFETQQEITKSQQDVIKIQQEQIGKLIENK